MPHPGQVKLTCNSFGPGNAEAAIDREIANLLARESGWFDFQHARPGRGRLGPIRAADYVDVEMTIRNHTKFLWHDVFAFNCLNPIEVPAFRDWKLERTYTSKQGKPFCMARTTRVKGHMPTVGFYGR